MAKTLRIFVIISVVSLTAVGCANEQTTWSAGGLAANSGVRNKLAAAFEGMCSDYAVADFAMFKVSAKVIHSTVMPVAQGTCTVHEEILEITHFASNADRDQFIEDRATALCAVSKGQDVHLLGLRWVVAERSSLQADSQGLALFIADAVDGEYYPTSCNEPAGFDWEPRAAEIVSRVANKLDGAGLGCSQIVLDDRDAAVDLGLYDDVGFPGASATCAIAKPGGAPTIRIVTFVADGLSADDYLRAYFVRDCGQMKSGAVAIGADVLAFTDESEVELVANALEFDRTTKCA